MVMDGGFRNDGYQLIINKLKDPLRGPVCQELFLEDLLLEDLDVFFFGTLAPSLRALESPMAIACFRLVTFFPDLPLFSVPFFFSCIAFSTSLPAFLSYLAIVAPFTEEHGTE